MPSSAVRSANFKPLTLPRSLSRGLSRLMAMHPKESLPLAKDIHEKATCPRQRNIAMRLRLRLLQEALHAMQNPVEDKIEPLVEVVPEPASEPKPDLEPTPPKPAAKTGKLVSMDLEGGALAMMMQGLGNNDDSDDFFSND